MSDIVERLRDRDSIVLSGLQYAVPVMLAAAEEIERLRRPSPVGRDWEALSELRRLYRAYVSLLETGRDRLMDRGVTCDPVDVMETGDPALVSARATIAALAASPSPWRSMESIRREALEEAVKCADNAEFRARGMVRGARGPKARSQALAAEAAAKQIKAAIRALKPLPAPPSEGELK